MPFNSIALHQLISSTIDMTLSQNSLLDFCNEPDLGMEERALTHLMIRVPLP
jgi:hypothetical protein